MKKFYTILIFFLLSFFLISGCKEPEGPAPLPPLEERIQAKIDTKVGPGLLQGVSIAVNIPGKGMWNVVGGISNEDTPIASNMRFGIASITKVAVGASILKLEEEGKLSLKDHLGKYISPDNPNVDDSVTIEQLLYHTSGFNGYMVSDLWEIVESDFQTPIPTSELTKYILEPHFSPGENHRYSNSNYLLLGMIIEAASGQTVGEFMRTRFWDPLGYEGVFFGKDEAPNGPVADGWRDRTGTGFLYNLSSEYGPAYHSVFFTAADLFFTAEDLAQWGQDLFNGNALTEGSKAKLLDFYPIFTGFDGWDGYGLGVRKMRYYERNLIGHTGGMRGYGTVMGFDPELKFSIALLNNQSKTLNGGDLRFQLMEGVVYEVLREMGEI